MPALVMPRMRVSLVSLNLRTNRFWSAYGKNVRGNDSFSVLIDNMYRLGLEASKKEIQNLPNDTFKEFFGPNQNRSNLSTIAAHCAKVLADQFKQRSNAEIKQLSSLAVPQEYSNLMRTFGIYPVASQPVAYLTHKARREFQEWFDTPLSELPTRGELVTFLPIAKPTEPSSQFSTILTTYLQDPSSIPVLSPDQIGDLALLMAPTIVQDVAGIFDQFGEVAWNGNHVDINSRKPTLSYQLLPYQTLYSLPHRDGRRESIFDDKGIVKGSDRIEPLLLFSMGVPKVGYMRQRGHHAISLVGREHFDDPYLLEKNFILDDTQ